MTKSDLCEPCSRNVGLPPQPTLEAGWTSYSPQARVSFDSALLDRLLGKPPRFAVHAYDLVLESLTEALASRQTSSEPTDPKHVPTAQLLEAFRQVVLARFDKRAFATLREMGIHRTEDIGEAVFELVDAGFCIVSPNDRKEDFANGFDFSEAFPNLDR